MDWVGSKPDLTLAQLQAKLSSEAGISLSWGRIWHLLKKLGLRLKKSRSTRSSGTAKPTAHDGKNSRRVEHLLYPVLQPGDVVVMDNLSAHKAPAVREWIEKAGAELLYLPPYSPDLNPIEKAWAKLKQLLRAAQARTKETLEQAIPEALPCITPGNAEAWFRLALNGLQ